MKFYLNKLEAESETTLGDYRVVEYPDAMPFIVIYEKDKPVFAGWVDGEDVAVVFNKLSEETLEGLLKAHFRGERA